MATLTIRNLPMDLVDRIKASAGRHGRSMEQELRDLLMDRYAARGVVLERMRQRSAALPSVTPDEIDQWIEGGRDEGTWTQSSTPT